MNSAANTHASTRSIQPETLNQVTGVLADPLVRSHFSRARLVSTGRLRSRPTLTVCTNVHGLPWYFALSVVVSAPFEPSQTARTQDTATTTTRNHSARQGL